MTLHSKGRPRLEAKPTALIPSSKTLIARKLSVTSRTKPLNLTGVTSKPPIRVPNATAGSAAAVEAMASSYPPPVSAIQVGSYFVAQYYQVLQQQPGEVHQFYSDNSTMILVDGDSIESCDFITQIHLAVSSLRFTSIEIKTINSSHSLGGGVLVMVMGAVRSRKFDGRRKFAQTFFLAPQNTGYYVLNDIFHFLEEEKEEVVLQHPPSNVISEGQFDIQLNAGSSPHREPPVLDYVVEEEAREYVNNVDVEDDPVDTYSLPEQQVPHQEFESELVVEETPQEVTYASYQNYVNTVQDSSAVSVEEPVGEPKKKTWASILRVAKGPSTPELTQQKPSFKSAQNASDEDHTAQPPVEQPNSTSDWSYAPQATVEAAEESYMPEDEGEMKSVYVRNLPPTVTEGEIEEAFKHFGQIIPDGVFVRARKENGVCYAFVEFEDMVGVHNALKASPIYLAGRQVYIDERRPNSGIAARGRGRGRGRGGYPVDATRGRFGGCSSGRGGYQDSGDYNRGRGNSFYQRGTR